MNYLNLYDLFFSEEIMDCEESTNFDINEDTEGLVTRFVWMDYLRAGGLAPGLGYLGAALGCQTLRVYTDLWLSRWTDLDVRIENSIVLHEEVKIQYITIVKMQQIVTI